MSGRITQASPGTERGRRQDEKKKNKEHPKPDPKAQKNASIKPQKEGKTIECSGDARIGVVSAWPVSISGGGDSGTGGGSSSASGPTRRTGGGGGASGSGTARRSGGAGKGSRGRGGHGRSSSDSHGGRRGQTRRGNHGAGGSSSSEDRGRRSAVPEVTVVSGKRQVIPSLVEVASSTELLGRLTLSDDRDQPVSSNIAHARKFAIDADAAAAKTTHIAVVKRAYKHTGLKDIARISVLPLSSSVDPSEAAQQLIRSVRSSMSDILMKCDELNSEGVRATFWVPGWEYLLEKSFVRAITPDKPTTAPLTALMEEFFLQVSRALKGGATGPEAFTLLLRLLSSHFDVVDTGADYKKLHAFGVPNGTPFCDFSRELRVVVSAATGTERVLAPGVDVVLEVVRMAVNEQYPSLMPTLYPGVLATEQRPFGTLDAMWLAFQNLAYNKTPAINGAKF